MKDTDDYEYYAAGEDWWETSTEVLWHRMAHGDLVVLRPLAERLRDRGLTREAVVVMLTATLAKGRPIKNIYAQQEVCV